MVGALGQLRDARKLGRRHGLDLDFQLQPRDEVRQAQGPGAQGVALLVLPIHLSTAAVFFGYFEPIEGPAMIEKLGDLSAVFRQLQREHLRTIQLDFGALHWIVVDENEAV